MFYNGVNFSCYCVNFLSEKLASKSYSKVREKIKFMYVCMHEKAENRRAGTKKAAIKRREKRSSKQTSSSKIGAVTKEGHSTVDNGSAQELCEECGRVDTPVVKRRPFRGFHVMAAFYGAILLSLVLTWRLN